MNRLIGWGIPAVLVGVLSAAVLVGRAGREPLLTVPVIETVRVSQSESRGTILTQVGLRPVPASTDSVEVLVTALTQPGWVHLIASQPDLHEAVVEQPAPAVAGDYTITVVACAFRGTVRRCADRSLVAPVTGSQPGRAI